MLADAEQLAGVSRGAVPLGEYFTLALYVLS
jgi:hypothetical protein